MRWVRLAAAATAGLLATGALLASPLVAVGPIVPPHVPVDLRWVTLPAVFALLQFAGEHVSWPGPALASLGTVLLALSPANLHASQVLAFLGVPWAQGGTALDLPVLAASLAAVGVCLWIAFDAARERFQQQVRARGIATADLASVSRRARSLARETVATSTVVVAGLALLVWLVGRAWQTSAAPLPEAGAILLVLAAGALLLGVPRVRRG